MASHRPELHPCGKGRTPRLLFPAEVGGDVVSEVLHRTVSRFGHCHARIGGRGVDGGQVRDASRRRVLFDEPPVPVEAGFGPGALRADVLAMKLARYRYRTDGADGPERLGFLIDDAPHTPAVAPDATQVDLYGYASMVVAAVQTQAKEIEALRREVSELRRTRAPKRAPRE